MSSGNFNKLQRVQNTLARVVLRRRKFQHITPSLVELHWLPIRQRTTFKLATLTYKLLHPSQTNCYILVNYIICQTLYISIILSATCDLLIKNFYPLLECAQSRRLVVLNILQFPFGTVCHLTFAIQTLYLVLDVS